MTEITRSGADPSSNRTQPADDLKQINGIGPAIERRLNANSIFTYSQLAGSTLEELTALFADIPGHNSKWLAEKDWIGQARALRVEPEADRGAEDLEPDELDFHDRQRYASFTVELLVDANRNVRRTRAYNIQAQQEVSWAGWDPARLVDFFAESGDLNLSGAVAAGPTISQKAILPQAITPEPMPAPKSSFRALSITTASVIAPGDNRPTWNLLAGQPFRVHLGVELTGMDALAAETAEYEATVDARCVGSRESTRLGRSSGALTAASRFEIEIEADGLPEGVYRPDALISLTLRDGSTAQQKTFRAVREGQSFVVS